MPRHKKALCKDALRNFLREPIKAYRAGTLETPEGRKAIARETEDRIEALFALYSIPDDWPMDMQWEWLARFLAGEHFPGCKTLNRGPGGPSDETKLRREQLKQALRTEFEAFKSGFPGTEFCGCAHLRQPQPKALQWGWPLEAEEPYSSDEGARKRNRHRN